MGQCRSTEAASLSGGDSGHEPPLPIVGAIAVKEVKGTPPGAYARYYTGSSMPIETKKGRTHRRSTSHAVSLSSDDSSRTLVVSNKTGDTFSKTLGGGADYGPVKKNALTASAMGGNATLPLVPAGSGSPPVTPRERLGDATSMLTPQTVETVPETPPSLTLKPFVNDVVDSSSPEKEKADAKQVTKELWQPDFVTAAKCQEGGEKDLRTGTTASLGGNDDTSAWGIPPRFRSPLPILPLNQIKDVGDANSAVGGVGSDDATPVDFRVRTSNETKSPSPENGVAELTETEGTKIAEIEPVEQSKRDPTKEGEGVQKLTLFRSSETIVVRTPSLQKLVDESPSPSTSSASSSPLPSESTLTSSSRSSSSLSDDATTEEKGTSHSSFVHVPPPRYASVEHDDDHHPDEKSEHLTKSETRSRSPILPNTDYGPVRSPPRTGRPTVPSNPNKSENFEIHSPTSSITASSGGDQRSLGSPLKLKEASSFDFDKEALHIVVPGGSEADFDVSQNPFANLRLEEDGGKVETHKALSPSPRDQGSGSASKLSRQKRRQKFEAKLARIRSASGNGPFSCGTFDSGSTPTGFLPIPEETSFRLLKDDSSTVDFSDDSGGDNPFSTQLEFLQQRSKLPPPPKDSEKNAIVTQKHVRIIEPSCVLKKRKPSVKASVDPSIIDHFYQLKDEIARAELDKKEQREAKTREDHRKEIIKYEEMMRQVENIKQVLQTNGSKESALENVYVGADTGAERPSLCGSNPVSEDSTGDGASYVRAGKERHGKGSAMKLRIVNSWYVNFYAFDSVASAYEGNWNDDAYTTLLKSDMDDLHQKETKMMLYGMPSPPSKSTPVSQRSTPRLSNVRSSQNFTRRKLLSSLRRFSTNSKSEKCTTGNECDECTIGDAHHQTSEKDESDNDFERRRMAASFGYDSLSDEARFPTVSTVMSSPTSPSPLNAQSSSQLISTDSSIVDRNDAINDYHVCRRQCRRHSGTIAANAVLRSSHGKGGNRYGFSLQNAASHELVPATTKPLSSPTFCDNNYSVCCMKDALAEMALGDDDSINRLEKISMLATAEKGMTSESLHSLYLFWLIQKLRSAGDVLLTNEMSKSNSPQKYEQQRLDVHTDQTIETLNAAQLVVDLDASVETFLGEASLSSRQMKIMSDLISGRSSIEQSNAECYEVHPRLQAPCEKHLPSLTNGNETRIVPYVSSGDKPEFAQTFDIESSNNDDYESYDDSSCSSSEDCDEVLGGFAEEDLIPYSLMSCTTP